MKQTEIEFWKFEILGPNSGNSKLWVSKSGNSNFCVPNSENSKFWVSNSGNLKL